MNQTEFSVSPALRDFLTYMKTSHLDELTRDYARRVDAYDLPMLRLIAHWSEEEKFVQSRDGLERFIGTLLDGTALEVAADGLRRWEADEIPGFSKYDFQPRDLILVGEAHEAAMRDFLDRYTDDRATATLILRELRAYYRQAELNAYETFTRIRDEAVQKTARVEAEQEALKLHLQETQALNEELLAQQEELNAQQEELRSLYAQLQQHTELVEEEVTKRTEELQAANEELEAHHEELLAVNDQLNQQTVELASQKTFVENLVAHMPTGIAYLDRALIFRWVNPAFAAFAHKDVAEFVERGYHDVFPTMENPNPRLTSVLESGQPSQVTGLSVTSRAGDTHHWDIIYVPVFDGEGRVDGLLLLSQNADARVRNEQLQLQRIEHLQEVDRLKNDFLGILSHELRTPVNAIMGFASILDDEIPGALNDEQHYFAQRILGGSDILLGLIEDLLDMSRIQAGKFSLSPEAIAPAGVVEEALATLAHLAEQKGQTLSLTDETAGAAIEADPQRLRQVVINLVGNAIKFGAHGDALAVRAAIGPSGFRCEVEDHGEGIAEADLPKLFQRFTQLDTGNTRKAGGVGLGLSIVKALVEAHGGTLGVRSEPGTKTVFWFELPLRAAVPAAPVAAE